MRSETPTKRLFLAFRPASSVRSRIAEVASKLPGGRPVPADNLHLTLVFLGATSAVQQAAYSDALNSIRWPRLQLELDSLGCWPRAGVLWLAPAQPPAALGNLVGQLNRTLAGCGFNPDRRLFRPHVTLARRYYKAVPELAAVGSKVEWPVDRAVLLASDLGASGPRYSAVEEWHSQ